MKKIIILSLLISTLLLSSCRTCKRSSRGYFKKMGYINQTDTYHYGSKLAVTTKTINKIEIHNQQTYIYLQGNHTLNCVKVVYLPNQQIMKNKFKLRTAFNLNIITISFFLLSGWFLDVMSLYAVAIVFLMLLPACSMTK